jgi:hypothetical protein
MKDLDYGWKGVMKRKNSGNCSSSTKSGINRKRETNKILSI